MAARSSSSCEVVDLGDDATSQLFFSKGGGDLSWPTAAAMPSTLTKRKPLVSLCNKYGVPREFEPVTADALGCAAACETPPQGSSALCIYSDALEAGLRFPLHDFYLKLLRHYRLAPSQLAPNAWKYMAAFVLLCKEAKVEPLVSVFRYLFSLYAHKDKRQDKPLGWYHFQPCAGRPRLFSGTLPTRHEWKTRFFFLKSPEGMSWKCPVAWGKPRREDARTVELTGAGRAAVDELTLLKGVDLKSFLSLHDPPVGALTQLQLHTTPVPMAKLECAAAGAQALLEAGARAAGEGDDSTPRKRRCLGPGTAAVTPQSSTISAPPPSLQAIEITPRTSFDGASGSSDMSLQPGIWTGSSGHEYDMVGMQGGQLQFKLQECEAKLRESEAMNDKLFEYLHKKKVENDLLKEKQARLIEEQAAVIARLKAEHQKEHASAVAQLTRLKEEHAASIAWLNEKHAADLACVKDAAEKKVQDVKNNILLILYPEADLSQLEGPKLKGDPAAAGMPEAEGRSATS